MQLTNLRSILFLLIGSTCLWAQPPAAPKVTHVLATLSVNPGITREQVSTVMQHEVRDTVQLYLDGKIEQWYARGDGKGVVLLMDCKTVEEAKAILETLPLVKAHYVTFDYMPLGPLSPLRVLLAQPSR
ncbi:hypothetical protein [Paludibaculum fermentans]|uniref:hypothetical protein n=1 Tax=Paludibaculum fermentans TaxID=1473598 RepID=UPI003EBAB7A6